jgi:hypothetical protein
MVSRRLILAGAVGLLGVLVFASVAFMGGKPKRYAPLFAVLDGGNEVSAEGEARAGDLDARGSATVLAIDADTICFSIIVHGTDRPTAAHIHRGQAGENGGVEVTLVAPKRGNKGTSSGCVDGVPKGLIQELERESGNFYINVHTVKFPGGAVRGQLF